MGPYIPLIVVNCLILGRTESFASHHSVGRSILDASGTGIGFTGVLVVLGAVREILGTGSVFGFHFLTEAIFTPWIVMILPGGAFLSLGLMIGIINYVSARRGGRVDELFMIFIGAAVVNNFCLGLLPRSLSFSRVSKKFDTALNMGLATTFVMTLSAAITWLIHHHLLVPYNVVFLEYVAFIIAISSLVQFVEMFIRKTSPPLYRSLGIFLPLITTNCAILGLALFAVLRDYSFVQTIFFWCGSGCRVYTGYSDYVRYQGGAGVCRCPQMSTGGADDASIAGMLALVFMGFAGLPTG